MPMLPGTNTKERPALLALVVRVGVKDASNIARAVKGLKNGGLVVFPTETVYGLACDPHHPGALRKLCQLKGRSMTKGLALQVESLEKARRLVKTNPAFERLAKKYWPGPLTIIIPSKRKSQNVGLRIPRHKFVLKLLKAYGKPLAVTSANPSGQKEIWRKQDLIGFLGSKVDMIFWQKLRPKEASTVVDLSGDRPVILRKGPIRLGDIQRAVKV